MTEIETYVALLAEAAAADPSAEELAATYRCIVDTIGCGIAGATEEAVQRVRDGVMTPGDAPIFGSADSLAPQDAVVVNGTAIRIHDFNDTFSERNNSHPSEHVIPLALAHAPGAGWTGEDFVRAVAVGYRMFVTSAQCWEGLLARGWAPSATIGAVAGTAYLAWLKGLDQAATAHAIAIATVSAPTLGGVFRGRISDLKSMVNGLSSRAAWSAVRLAKAGVTGPLDVFESAAGWDEMVGGPFGAPDGGQNTAERVILKGYPAVFTVHSCIAAACELASAGELRASGLRGLTVAVPPKVEEVAAAESRWRVQSREEAQFSLPWLVATALRFGRCGLAEIDAAVGGDPEVRALVDLMTVVSDPQWTGYFGGRVEAWSTDGSSRVAEAALPPGHADRPLTEAQVWDKFRGLVAMARDEGEVAIAEQALRALRSAPDTTALLEACRGRAAGGRP